MLRTSPPEELLDGTGALRGPAGALVRRNAPGTDDAPGPRRARRPPRSVGVRIPLLGDRGAHLLAVRPRLRDRARPRRSGPRAVPLRGTAPRGARRDRLRLRA